MFNGYIIMLSFSGYGIHYQLVLVQKSIYYRTSTEICIELLNSFNLSTKSDTDLEI